MSNEYRHEVDAGMGGLSMTIATLPAAFTLGENRYDSTNQQKFKLVYNAGNSAINPGFAASPVPTGSGAYSVTVTTTSKTYHAIGAVLVHHATVPTANYFWGLVRGYVASGVAADAATITTGAGFYLSADGKFSPLAGSVATGNKVVGVALNGPSAGTVAVRQSSVLIDLESA